MGGYLSNVACSQIVDRKYVEAVNFVLYSVSKSVNVLHYWGGITQCSYEKRSPREAGYVLEAL